jgi:cyclopropane-fatty-acyl-phospholipid synthase
MNYSCAYFTKPTDTIETAQQNKLRHIAAKLDLKPGQRVLDIGSGWGGLALYLAAAADVEVLGVTLSTEQLALATQRAKERGLDKRVRFELMDYREVKGTFDRVVSVGMFEHVGVVYYDEFFSRVRDLLKPDGVALLHSIGRKGGPSSTSSWIRKYIFPGGYSPALSEVFSPVERAGFWVTDVEILRLHYAKTLRAWEERFQSNRAKITQLMDERFCRMWEFYLIASELSFSHGKHMVFQIQLTKDRDTLPITRDYISEVEAKLKS